jgi:hypothetical protein
MMRLLPAALALALAACETTPAPPLMSPIEQARAFGYSERQTGPQDWEVTYVAPARQSSRFEGTREADKASARTQAFDLMLWRAAQITLAQGYTGFRVGQTRTNIETLIEDDVYDPFWGPGYGPWGWGYPGWGPYRRRPYFPPPYRRSYWVYIQARVSGDIHFLQATSPGDYVAEDVIAQARRTYPGAEGGPIGVEGAPSQ